MMTAQTGDMAIVNRGPGWAFGYGGAMLTDPVSCPNPAIGRHLRLGRRVGPHLVRRSGPALSVMALSNTALEGMMGRYVRDLRNAICKVMS